MNDESARMNIRVTKTALAFAIADEGRDAKIRFQPYVSKSGVSPAANLREAFKTADLLQARTRRAQVLVDTPPLLVPIEEYDEQANAKLYMHGFPRTTGSVVMANVLPSLNAVALFAVNKDLRLVVSDHYDDVAWTCLMRPVWAHLHRRSFVGSRRKLYAHFHDGKLELFSFERNRFIFCNRYATTSVKNAAYFTLFVWKQLALDQQRDELYLSGEFGGLGGLATLLKEYVAKVITISLPAEFNRAPMAQLRGITFDMVANYLN